MFQITVVEKNASTGANDEVSSGVSNLYHMLWQAVAFVFGVIFPGCLRVDSQQAPGSL